MTRPGKAYHQAAEDDCVAPAPSHLPPPALPPSSRKPQFPAHSRSEGIKRDCANSNHGVCEPARFLQVTAAHPLCRHLTSKDRRSYTDSVVAHRRVHQSRFCQKAQELSIIVVESFRTGSRLIPAGALGQAAKVGTAGEGPTFTRA